MEALLGRKAEEVQPTAPAVAADVVEGGLPGGVGVGVGVGEGADIDDVLAAAAAAEVGAGVEG